MVDGHQGWPEQLCRSGPAALDRLACFYYYYYYYYYYWTLETLGAHDGARGSRDQTASCSHSALSTIQPNQR